MLEAELARLIVETVPCAERVVLSTSGSEAVQVAVRIARAKTRKRTVLKFDGHYHGWMEPVSVNALGTVPVTGPPPLELVPSVAEAGLPGEVIVCPWNDTAALAAMLERFGHEIACVIMEPVRATSAPSCRRRAISRPAAISAGRTTWSSIFDEVVTGFRLALGGAQELLGVTPDMAVFAKAIASGSTIAAVAGTAEAMAPAADGPVYIGGTYNGAGPSAAAAIATIGHLRDHPEIYGRVDALTGKLAGAINDAAASAGLPLFASQVGGVVHCCGDRGSRSATTPGRAPAIRLRSHA